MLQPSEILHPSQAILVLGMHRSGTSALTGSLELCGAATPQNQIKAGAQNPKGFFEAAQVARLNDRLLNGADLTWENWHPLPPAHEPPQKDVYQAAVDLVTAEFCESPLIALKDPRICRLVPFWDASLRQAGYQPSYILTVRHPLEVANSLIKRNRLSKEHGMLLWLTYVLDAERDTRYENRAFTSFDQLMSDPGQTLSKLSKQIGGRLSQNACPADDDLNAFLSPDLRHHSESSCTDLPPVWQETYDIFTRWAQTAEDVDDHERLDEIRALCRPVLQKQEDPEEIYDALQILSLSEANGTSETDQHDLDKTTAMQNTLVLKRKAFLLQKQLGDEADKTRRLTAQADRQAQELATLSKLLLAAEEQTASLSQQLLEQATAQVMSPEQMESEAQADRLLSDNRGLRQAIVQQETTRRDLERHIEELNALVARVENERHALASSTIWRASKPLRVILQLFRRA